MPLLFHYPRHHLALPSFPTRRSSDLVLHALPIEHLAHIGAVAAAQTTGGERLRAEFSRDPRQVRSEEHTSELQSPCNLVCRLLLEKKKNYTQNDNARQI